MITDERTGLVAACGIDCGTCELYLCKEDQKLLSYLVSKGIPKEKLPCTGCRDIKGNCPVIGDPCATYTCAAEKEIDYCFDCREFPCATLHPAADRAGVLPHNLKVFNLCTIQRDGVEAFTRTSAEIKKRYFKGTMAIGSGPLTIKPC